MMITHFVLIIQKSKENNNHLYFNFNKWAAGSYLQINKIDQNEMLKFGYT